MWCTAVSAYRASLYQRSDTWIINLGTTDHVTNNNEMLISSTPCTGFVKAASGTMIQIMARGQAIISVNGCKVQPNDALLVPDANVNLMSV